MLKKRIDSLCGKKNLDVSDLILEVYDQSGLSRQFSHTDTKRSRETLLNLRPLHELASNFEEFHGKDLSLFIDYLEILDEMDGNPLPARIADEDAINLMTIHSAKGLEFGVVFLTNLAKDKFPLYRGCAEPLIPPELMEQYRDIFADKSVKDIEKVVRERKREIKKEEEITDALISLGLGRPVAMTLAYLNNGDEATSDELETGTGLRQPEVSIVMRQLKEHDWINERDEKKTGKGRPYKIYSLKVGFNEIIAQLEKHQKKAVDDDREDLWSEDHKPRRGSRTHCFERG